MGTRAQFFIGDPRDLEGRIWLGCVAWDGYPGGDVGEALDGANDDALFLAGVAQLKAERDDFCDPTERSFPFPWKDDLFLTDCTYALFDGEVQYASFHRGFIPLSRVLSAGESDEIWAGIAELPGNVPAPTSDLPKGPDSIMILSVAR